MKRLLILLLPLLVLLLPAQSLGQTGNRAGIVVKFSDGRVLTSCVSFKSESISGLDLLQRSGLEVIAQTSGSNAAVCKIGSDGCSFPAEPCFCKFGSGQQGQYWSYWRRKGDTWQYAAQGAGLSRVGNGDVDGWSWGTGNVQSDAQPPVISFDRICPAAPVKPTAPPKPTAKPTPKPTPKPTARPTPRPTARPTIAPTAPLVAEVPTAAPEQPTATSIPTPTPTIVPTDTARPTTTPPPTPTAIHATTQPAATPTPTSMMPPESQASNLGGYLIFGIMLSGLLGAIGFAQWRRRR